MANPVLRQLAKEVNIVIRHGITRWPDCRDMFDEVRSLLAQKLASANFVGGPFTLIPIEFARGSEHKKGIGPARVHEGRVLITVQPGSNDTAFKYKLELPRPLTAEQVATGLNYDDASLKPFSEPAADVRLPEAANDIVLPALSDTAASAVLSAMEDVDFGALVLDPDKKLEPTTPHQFLDDPVLIATALCELFTGANLFALESDVRGDLAENFGWNESETMQVMLGLEARNYVRRMTRGDGFLYVELLQGSSVCTELARSGFVVVPSPCVPSVDLQSAEPPKSAKAGLRNVISQLTAGKPIQRIRAGESGLPPGNGDAKPVAKATKRPPARAIATPTGIAVPPVEAPTPSAMFDINNVGRLKKMSVALRNARAELPGLTKTTDELAGQIETVRAELERLSATYAEAETRRKHASDIVKDPDHIAAADTIAKLLATLTDE
ncbi:MAG: hypothetical protein KBC38_00715 [Candidatus Pacebacteria bacterium]|nr:hypothetical protein [Candidatus Paceibacterota bacterium]MBP9840518.1 hypothetical protein [Candidatus Paceibacterota bacterium]